MSAETKRYLAQLAELLEKATETTNPEIAASYLAKLQRLSGHALRSMIGDCIEAREDVDWRWLATCTQVPPGTLRQQVEKRGRVVIWDPGTPVEPDYTVDDVLPEDGHRYRCCGKIGRISRHETWCPTNRAS